MFLTIIVFLAILSVLVLVHEAGHFFVAKKLGIKVEEFGFGFPPRAFAFKKGETVYSFNWLPIGGFVKLYGEDEAGGGRLEIKDIKIKDKSRAFFARPVWQKALVVVAGVFMNFVLAVLILSFLFSAVGVAVQSNKVIVANVSKDSPAQIAGLKPGDLIESLGGVAITSTQALIDITKKHLGEQISLKVKTAKGQEELISLTPRKNYPQGEGPIGVLISQNFEIKKYPWYQAPFVGLQESGRQSYLIVLGLWTVLYSLFAQGQVPQGVAGPVGIAQLTGQVVQFGLPAVLSFVSLLSLNLAILNILPIPALDGGRLLFILIEGVTRKRVNPKFESYTHVVGMAILLSLVALITLHDLIRIFKGQPILPNLK
jgi:regulator of sigma E protease